MKRLCDFCFVCSWRLGDFLCVERLLDFFVHRLRAFLVKRLNKFFVDRLRVFFLKKDMGFCAPRGYMNFVCGEVGSFFSLT